jgi:hypothetical protein
MPRGTAWSPNEGQFTTWFRKNRRTTQTFSKSGNTPPQQSVVAKAVKMATVATYITRGTPLTNDPIIRKKITSWGIEVKKMLSEVVALSTRNETLALSKAQEALRIAEDGYILSFSYMTCMIHDQGFVPDFLIEMRKLL